MQVRSPHLSNTSQYSISLRLESSSLKYLKLKLDAHLKYWDMLVRSGCNDRSLKSESISLFFTAASAAESLVSSAAMTCSVLASLLMPTCRRCSLEHCVFKLSMYVLCMHAWMLMYLFAGGAWMISGTLIEWKKCPHTYIHTSLRAPFVHLWASAPRPRFRPLYAQYLRISFHWRDPVRRVEVINSTS